MGRGIYLGGGQYRHPVTGEAVSVLAITNADTGDVRRVPLPFLPHGVALDPCQPDRVAVFEKRGPGAATVDLAHSASLAAMTPAKGCHFYGHGVFSADGSLLYATETRLDDHSGQITVRDAKTLAVVDVFPSFGMNPHDCMLVEQGRVMAITNGGGVAARKEPRGCVTLVDISSRRLLRRIEMPDARFNTGHLRPLPDGRFAVGSAPGEGLSTPHPGSVSLAQAGAATLTRLTKPASVVERMKGEALSLAYAPASQVFAVTHPDGDMVTFWSLNSGRLVKALSLEKPRGIALSPGGDAFMVAYGAEASLVGVSSGPLQVMKETLLEHSFLSGSHIFSLAEMLAGVLA